MNTVSKVLRQVCSVLLMFGVVVVACCVSHAPTPTANAPTCNGNSCQPPVTDSGATQQEAGPTPVKMVLDHFEFTLPDSGWESLEVDEEPPMLINKEKNNLIAYGREAFKGNAMQFALIAVYTLRQAGGQIVSAKNVMVSQRDWLVIEAVSPVGDARLWYWIGFSEHFGYKFKCGGEAADESQRALCAEIGSTLKINP